MFLFNPVPTQYLSIYTIQHQQNIAHIRRRLETGQECSVRILLG